MSFFNSLFRSEKEWLVIEIGDRRIRLAQVALLRGHPEILRLAGAEISANQEDDAAQALRRLLDSHHLQSHCAILNVPRRLTLMKFVKLPSTDAAEIRQLAKMEILRQMPYAEDEMIDAYKIIRTESDGYSLVLLVAVLKKTVNKMVEVLKSCALRVEKVALGAESLAFWFLENFSDLKDRNVLFISAGLDTLDVEVFEKGELVFSRGVALAAPVDEAAFLNEVAVSTLAYQNTADSKLEEICFLGPAPLAARVRALFQKVQLPLRVVDLTGSSVSFSAELQKDVAYAGLLGLGRHFSEINADLTTPELAKEKRVHELTKQIATAFVWILILLIGGFGCVLKKNYEEKRLLSLMETEIKKNELPVKEANRMKQFLDAAGDTLNARPLAVDIFTEIHRAAPVGIALDLFDYEDRERLTLRGSASPSQAVFEYTRALEKSAWLSHVQVRYVTKRVVNSKETADFEIQAGISAAPGKS